EAASGLRYEPLYYVAVCSRQAPGADWPGLALFGDAEESVYQHYNGEVRKNMAAGARIAELEAQLPQALREHEPKPETGPGQTANTKNDSPRTGRWPWWPRGSR